MEEYQQARTRQSLLANAYPQIPEYTRNLFGTCFQRHRLLAEMNRLPESLVDLNQAFSLVQDLRKSDPNDPKVGDFQRFALVERASLLTKLGRTSQADADWDHVLDLVAGMHLMTRNEVRLRRAISRAEAGDYRRSAPEADEMSRAGLREGRDLFNLACTSR